MVRGGMLVLREYCLYGFYGFLQPGFSSPRIKCRKQRACIEAKKKQRFLDAAVERCPT